MAKVVVNATHKGGEGKTTNSIILAEYIIPYKLKTLIIDRYRQIFSGRYIKMEYDPSYKAYLYTRIMNPLLIKTGLVNSIANIFYGEEVSPIQR